MNKYIDRLFLLLTKLMIENLMFKNIIKKRLIQMIMNIKNKIMMMYMPRNCKIYQRWAKN